MYLPKKLSPHSSSILEILQKVALQKLCQLLNIKIFTLIYLRAITFQKKRAKINC